MVMKIRGGYTPRISGRPASTLEEAAFPSRLFIRLQRRGIAYSPVVENGRNVGFGEPLAEASTGEGTLVLPSPARGKVFLAEEGDKIVLDETEAETHTELFRPRQPERISDQELRRELARGGLWPFFWSSYTGGAPSLNTSEKPQAIIVNTVLTEPFRARGKVALRHSWDRIIQGLIFLPRMLREYGKLDIVLTEVGDPLARKMYTDLAGHAWIRFHAVPLTYPVENPAFLSGALRSSISSLNKEDPIWIIDVHGVEAMGAFLAGGLPLHRRMVVAGGPGCPEPKHTWVRIGTPLSSLWGDVDEEEVLVLRGGLLLGTPVDPASDAVQYDDNGYFFLPEVTTREFLSFMRPGFDRTSYLPCFASRIVGSPDSTISTSLRGEPRPCIACGACEAVCPVYLMPQIIHRYLYKNDLDEAERAGLEICVDCNLCTYVCPSKIELQKQFAEAREQIRAEREEALAATQGEENSP